LRLFMIVVLNIFTTALPGEKILGKYFSRPRVVFSMLTWSTFVINSLGLVLSYCLSVHNITTLHKEGNNSNWMEENLLYVIITLLLLGLWSVIILEVYREWRPDWLGMDAQAAAGAMEMRDLTQRDAQPNEEEQKQLLPSGPGASSSPQNQQHPASPEAPPEVEATGPKPEEQKTDDKPAGFSTAPAPAAASTQAAPVPAASGARTSEKTS